MNSNFANAISNSKVQQAYDVVVEKRLDKVNKRANEAIKSFADLIDEIDRLQNESKGSTVDKEVKPLATDLTNTSVLVTRMLTAQLEALHNIVNTKSENPAEEATV